MKAWSNMVMMIVMLGVMPVLGQDPAPAETEDLEIVVPADPAPADLTPVQSETAFTGDFSIEYAPRLAVEEDIGDEDIYLGLRLDYGDADDTFSGSLYARMSNDVDGTDGPADDPFKSAYDAEHDGNFAQLFYAYLDIQLEGIVDSARIGRQYIYDGQPFHFDGFRATSVKAKGAMGFHGSIFAGVPVHYFEENGGGDWLAGIGVEMHPWEQGHLKLVLAHVEDEFNYAGLSGDKESDDLLFVSLSSLVQHFASVQASYTSVDGTTRDLVLRGQAAFQKIDTETSLSVYIQPEELEDLSNELAVFGAVQGISYPNYKVDLWGSKGFPDMRGWKFNVEGRFQMRRLMDADDEGQYNRDFEAITLGVGLEAPEELDLSIAISQTLWTSSGTEEVQSLDAEVRWGPRADIKLALGTTFSLYKYDLLTAAEEENVTETYAKGTWKPEDWAEIKVKVAMEDFEDESIQILELGCTIKF